MTRRWAGWSVPLPILLLSAVVTVIFAAPVVASYLIAGVPAALALGLGFLTSLRPALSLRPLHALALVIPAAMAGTVAVALRGQPLVAACFVALCCLLVAPAVMLGDALLSAVPTSVAVLVLVPGDFQPARTGVWLLLGGALMVAVATRLPRSAPAAGVEQRRAWRHAAVMALAVAAVVYLVELWQVPDGYWVALTLTVVLRPFDDKTIPGAAGRVCGTIVAALVALGAAVLAPLWSVLGLLLLSTVLSVAYSLHGDRLRQLLFLTPAVVLLGSAGGNAGVVVSERALATIAGALLAAAIAMALAMFETRRAVVAG